MSYFGNREFYQEIAEGNVPGYSIVQKFGRNDAVGTSYVPITSGGIYRTPQSGSATALRIAAGNVNDDTTGTGARTIVLQGIDETGAEVQETVSTNGTSAGTASTTTFMRLHRAWVATSGTYATQSAGSHSADIVIENSAGTETWATIESTGFPEGQTEVAAYTIPSGYTGYVISANITVDTSKTTDLLLFKRENILETSAPYTAMRAQFLAKLAGQNLTFTPKSAIGPITGPADVGWLGKVSATTSQVAIDFEILLVAD